MMIYIIGKENKETARSSDIQNKQTIASNIQSENNKNIKNYENICCKRRFLISIAIVSTIIACASCVLVGVKYGLIDKSNIDKVSHTTDLRMSMQDSLILSKNTNNNECGKQQIFPFLQSRIVNGYEARRNSWPWMVSIGLFGPSMILSHACGGTLINKRYVLTATHCVYEKIVYSLIGNPIPNNPKYSNLNSMIRIFIGIHDRSNDINTETTYYASEVINFINFDEITFENDISLIKLDRDVEISDKINFICLAKSIQIQPGDTLYAVGWGYTKETDKQASRYLMQVSVNVKSENNCELNYKRNVQFCAGSSIPRKDTCNGDSGGPLVKYYNGRWTLVGIVSNGDASCDGVGIYTIVSHYYDWIYSNSQILN